MDIKEDSSWGNVNYFKFIFFYLNQKSIELYFIKFVG